METLAGTASAVTHSILPSGEYGEHSVHVTTFLLDGVHPVRLEASSRPAIVGGELVAVVGTVRGSVLKALAYQNLSTCESGNVGKFEAFFGGIGALAFALWWASGLVAALAVAAGLWLLFRSVRIALAEHDLKHEAARRRAMPQSSTGTPLGDA